MPARDSVGVPQQNVEQSTGEAITQARDVSGESFITQEDVKNTVSIRKDDYTAVVCDKCGNRLFISRERNAC